MDLTGPKGTYGKLMLNLGLGVHNLRNTVRQCKIMVSQTKWCKSFFDKKSSSFPSTKTTVEIFLDFKLVTEFLTQKLVWFLQRKGVQTHSVMPKSNAAIQC